MNKKVVKIKKEKRKIPYALLYCYTTQNNTILSLTTLSGDVIGQSSCGSVGFKGSKKSSSYAAQKAAEKIMELAKAVGVVNLGLYFRGFGLGRVAVASVIKNYKILISFIADNTGLQHGGCKRKKERRN